MNKIYQFSNKTKWNIWKFQYFHTKITFIINEENKGLGSETYAILLYYRKLLLIYRNIVFLIIK